jgi:hypothetical protein
MRTISSALKDRFAREALTICRCVAIKTKGGQEYYLTDLTRPISVFGKDFLPEPKIDVSAIRTGKSSNEQNAEVTLTYMEEGLTERAVRFGLLNEASVEIYWVDYIWPQYGGVLMMAGRVAGVEQPKRSFCTLSVAAAKTGGNTLIVAEVYSKRCRNVFGDKRCKVDIDALSVPFTVIQTFNDRAQFAINGFADFIPPVPDPEAPPAPVVPWENGTLSKLRQDGETYFTVPKAQILKIKMLSGGGGGGTSGGNPTFRRESGRFYMDPGFPGVPGFPTRLLLMPSEKILFELQPGAPGKGQEKVDTRDGPNFFGPPYIAKAADGNCTFPAGALRPDKITPGAGGIGGQGGVVTPAQGQAYVDEGFQYPNRGGQGGNGVLIEHTFNLEDPACPIKVGDQLHFNIGAPGASPDGYPNDNEIAGSRGESGGFEVTWQSNEGLNTDTPTDDPVNEKTYNNGSVLWVTGDNAGGIVQIADNTAGLITLTNSPSQEISVGDTGLFRPGCSNFADMCEDRWDNLINMQAEPVTPQGTTTAPAPLPDKKEDVTKPPVIGSTGSFGTPDGSYVGSGNASPGGA